MKNYIYFILCLILITTTLFTHSGRTDKNGGHTNKKTGEYHYHNKGTSTKKIKPDPPVAKADPRVYFIQSSLLILGYRPVPINGVMTPETVEVIKKFQQDNSLTVTGEINNDTKLKILKRLEARPF